MAKGSRGGKGREGGGGGLDPANIISSESLLSYSGKREEIDEVMSAVKDTYDEYGNNLEDIQVATLNAKESGTLAFFGGDTLSVNKAFFDAKKLTEAYDQSVSSGYHPRRGNKTGMQAVIAHELGHKLNYDIQTKLAKSGQSMTFDQVATKIMKEARAITKDKGVVIMSRKISRYATASNAEAVAEAYADVYCNGRRASSASKAIMKVVNSYLK